jgi:alpha-glucoside transport system permease protein
MAAKPQSLEQQSKVSTAKPQSFRQQRRVSSVLVNLTLTIICIIWLIPVVGLLITSFRQSQDIFKTGWWTIFPHREYIDTRQIILDPSVNVDGDFQVEGITTNFTDLRNGVTAPNGEKLTWYGNKRTRTIDVSELRWVGFSTNMTLDNYTAVLGGKTVTFKDATGRDIETRGPNLGGAFLNSIAVTIPATIIPILIAAFAAYGFAWLNFPGRKLFFIGVVAMLVVPLQIALVPILQDYTRLQLNGTYLAIWLAHTGFGLPLAIYLLFNYMATLPREILESAFIDGASNFTIFTRLILPLSIPALAAFAIFQFLWVWNDYLVALIFLNPQTQVVTMALASLVGERGQDWHLLTAGAFVSMILPLTVFFMLQRYFVRGLMAGSVKG